MELIRVSANLFYALWLCGILCVISPSFGEPVLKVKKSSQESETSPANRDTAYAALSQEPWAPNSFSLTGRLVGMYYVEDIPPPTDTETGLLPGVGMELRALVNERVMIYGAFNFDFGGSRYDGALQDGTPETSTTNNLIFNGEGGVGYALLSDQRNRFGPYVGFGVHYWSRGLTGVGGYGEHYLFYYLPVGIRFETRLSPSFTIGIDGAFHWNLGGSIQVLLSQLTPPQQDASGTLGTAIGMKVQVPMTYQIGSKLALKVAPFFEYFRIGKGDPFTVYDASGKMVDSSYEPSSATNFYGADAGIHYMF